MLTWRKRDRGWQQPCRQSGGRDDPRSETGICWTGWGEPMRAGLARIRTCKLARVPFISRRDGISQRGSCTYSVRCPPISIPQEFLLDNSILFPSSPNRVRNHNQSPLHTDGVEKHKGRHSRIEATLSNSFEINPLV